MTENRKNPRITTDRAIQVITPSGAKVSAKIVSLSVSGAGIFYQASSDIGTELNIIFKIPFKGKLVEINIMSVVRHTCLSGGGYIIGVEFIDLDKEVADMLGSYIKEKIKELSRVSDYL